MTAILRLQLKIDVFSCCFSFVMEKYNSRTHDSSQTKFKFAVWEMRGSMNCVLCQVNFSV